MRIDRNAIQLLELLRLRVIRELDSILQLRDDRSLKRDNSYVTGGDILINNIIEQELQLLDTDIVLISEELLIEEIDALNANVLVVDPIDGTENFTSGLPIWGVSLSMYIQGKHAASLIGCPELNSWIKSGDKIKGNFSRISGLSSSLSKEELLKVSEGIEYRVFGCSVFNMISVIRGSFKSFENPRGAHSWDILAGLNLALENKLKVTVDGKPYTGEYLQADRKYKFRVEHQ